jgi:hypothetical protein
MHSRRERARAHARTHAHTQMANEEPINERGRARHRAIGGCVCRQMCSLIVFELTVLLPRLLFCNFTAKGVQAH